MTAKTDHRRTNEEWLAALLGQMGSGAQTEAYTDLARYLYVVLYNYLHARKADVPTLATLTDDQIGGIAEDFVQDVLIRIPKLAERFRGEGRFTTWAAVVARNTIGQQLRRKEWRGELEPLEEPITEEAEPLFRILEDRGATPEYTTLQAEIWETIRKCVESLPAAWREAFVLMVFEDRSAEEVAELLDVSKQSVFIRAHRAKNRLRRCIAEAGWELEDILEAFALSGGEEITE